jgi:hypothetical protein
MIRVCVVSQDADRLRAVLVAYGFEISTLEHCHIIIADAPIPDVKVPVVVYSKETDLELAIAEIAKQFKPLHDTLDECLNLCKKG